VKSRDGSSMEHQWRLRSDEKTGQLPAEKDVLALSSRERLHVELRSCWGLFVSCWVSYSDHVILKPNMS